MNRPSEEAIARARKIRLLLFDVDGVLTDGVIWYFPVAGGAAEADEPADAQVQEVKGFSAHDGIGIVLARRGGLKTGVITKRKSVSLALRARNLRMDYIRQGIDRKREAMAEIQRDCGCDDSQTCCMGDDLVDLPMMHHCGLAAAPADARPEVLAAAHFVAPNLGGRGAARDLIEFILKAQGAWDRLVQEYLREPDPESHGTRAQ